MGLCRKHTMGLCRKKYPHLEKPINSKDNRAPRETNDKKKEVYIVKEKKTNTPAPVSILKWVDPTTTKVQEFLREVGLALGDNSYNIG